MSKVYRSVLNRNETPQSQPIPNSKQVKNNAGGYAFGLDCWKRLERFLILGSEGGTYYVGENQLTIRNAKNLLECIKLDGKRTVDTIIAISDAGRAPKNDPAIFALAVCASYGSDETKKYALSNLSKVARIGTHLFTFVSIVDGMRGWGRGLRSAIASWYNDKNPNQLAYQLVKYQQRNGWSHRDVLRLAHVVPATPAHNAGFGWAVNGAGDIVEHDLRIIEGFERAKSASSAEEIVGLIDTYGLTREMIPTAFLNSADVWRALLVKMPMTALIRNLGKISSLGIAGNMDDECVAIVDKITNKVSIQRARVHPLNIYSAYLTYRQGQGYRGSLSWTPNARIIDALDDAFYLAFDNVESTGKRIYLGLDVSGSMSASINNMPYLSARDATALMAMVTMRSEKYYVTKAFSSATGRNAYSHKGIYDFPITPKMSIGEVSRLMRDTPFGGTDCSLPMVDALASKTPVDTFIVYTDNETWAGRIHPVQALQKYRNAMGIPAKLIVVGMTASGFSIADPDDEGMLDVVGFDSATPKVIAEFSK